jgi:hypothetical protein
MANTVRSAARRSRTNGSGQLTAVWPAESAAGRHCCALVRSVTASSVLVSCGSICPFARRIRIETVLELPESTEGLLGGGDGERRTSVLECRLAKTSIQCARLAYVDGLRRRAYNAVE